MILSHALLRSVFLGSAVAMVALAPAMGSEASKSDLNRLRALYGNRGAVAHSNAGVTTASASGKATYTAIHKFAGGTNDGANSGARVTLDDAGNIYGTTDFGNAHGDGTVFKVAPDGTETILYSFSGGADGSQPDGAVTLMGNGDMYGTTSSGGASGNGTLFKMNSKGKLKTLHNFTSDDGSDARGNLYRDKLGNFYGTALFSGSGFSGTVFKYGFDGTFTVLHSFNGTDGEYPEHGVVADKAGNLYGVTAFGGTGGEGTVFKIDTGGNFSTLYNFTGGADGGFLYGGLAIDGDGNLYGSTGNGGANASGTVFKLTPGGTLTTLYNFTGGTDGSSPEGDMLLVGKKLYSSTTLGGDPTCQCGVVYEVSMTGQQKVLHAFTGPDGSGYSAGLTLANGLFYGTVQYGGVEQNGVVFSLTKK